MDSTTVRAAGALAQHAQATGKSVALSSAAKTLTGYIFGDVSNLPTFLQSYGHLLRIVIGGAGVVGGLYNYFHCHQNDKTKIEFAVFRVVRVLESLLDGELERLSEHTEELHRFISNEIHTKFGLLMNQFEREATVLQSKRKLSSMTREREEAKRQRQESAVVTDTVQRRASEEADVAQA
jgi:hypothetical protein